MDQQIGIIIIGFSIISLVVLLIVLATRQQKPVKIIRVNNLKEIRPKPGIYTHKLVYFRVYKNLDTLEIGQCNKDGKIIAKPMDYYAFYRGLFE